MVAGGMVLITTEWDNNIQISKAYLGYFSIFNFDYSSHQVWYTKKFHDAVIFINVPLINLVISKNINILIYVIYRFLPFSPPVHVMLMARATNLHNEHVI